MAISASQVVSDVNSDQRSYGRIPNVLDVPNLSQVQLDSFNWFKTDGMKELLEEVSPIEDFPGGAIRAHVLGPSL